MTHKITTPVNPSVIKALKAGDEVIITGTIYTARDSAHKIIRDMLKQKKQPPFDLAGAIIYYAGPTPSQPGKPIGSVGPTTAGRMDKYAPLLMEKGVKVMIGKGPRSDEVVKAIKKYNAVYLACVGGAAGYLAKRVKKSKLVAFEYLGPEAVYCLEVEDFPAVVINDAQGRDFYKKTIRKWAKHSLHKKNG